MKFCTTGSLKLSINKLKKTTIEIMVIIVRFKSFFLFIFSFKRACVYTNILNLYLLYELSFLSYQLNHK